MKYSAPRGINTSAHIGWCPGCGHGIICRILAEAAQELGIDDRMIMVEDVACGEYAQFVMHYNSIGGAHGRTLITAAGAKRARPDAIVVAHPGDGSAYSIGIESTMHCAIRNENILALIVNNSIYGMTGGQMSPATLLGMKTASSPKGRRQERDGSPFDAMKVIGQMDVAYCARGSVSTPGNVEKSKKMIKKALQKQMNGEGFCLVEILSPCPTNWYMQPDESIEFMKKEQEKVFALGEFKDGGKA